MQYWRLTFFVWTGGVLYIRGVSGRLQKKDNMNLLQEMVSHASSASSHHENRRL